MSPLVVVEKQDGSIGICLDARALNNRLVNANEQPLTIDEILAEIQEASIYSKIDIQKAF